MNGTYYDPFLRRTAVSTSSSNGRSNGNGTGSGDGGGDSRDGLVAGVLSAVVFLSVVTALYQWGKCCYECCCSGCGRKYDAELPRPRPPSNSSTSSSSSWLARIQQRHALRQFERGRRQRGAAAAAEATHGAARQPQQVRPRHDGTDRSNNVDNGTGIAAVRERSLRDGDNAAAGVDVSLREEGEEEAELRERRLRVLQWLPSFRMVLADGNFPPPERSARSEGDGPDDIGGRSEPNRSHNDGKILIPAPGLLLSGAPRDGSDAKARSVHGVDDTGSSTGAPPSSPSGPRESDIAGSLQPWDVLSWGPTMRWASWTCTICLGAYHVGESVTWSSNSECDHCFHTSCIEEWLLRRPPYRPPRRQQARETGGNSYAVPACPNCRRDFVKDPYEIDG